MNLRFCRIVLTILLKIFRYNPISTEQKLPRGTEQATPRHHVYWTAAVTERSRSNRGRVGNVQVPGRLSTKRATWIVTPSRYDFVDF